MRQDIILRIQNPPYGSLFWNDLISAKSIITNEIKCIHGSEEQVYIWEDARIKEIYLFHIKEYKDGVEQALRNQGETIDKYYDNTINRWRIY